MTSPPILNLAVEVLRTRRLWEEHRRREIRTSGLSMKDYDAARAALREAMWELTGVDPHILKDAL